MNAEDHKLLQFLAATVESIRDRMATKNDIASVREEMATKEEILSLREEMATKDDVLSVRKEMASKADVAAIRGDIERVHIRIDSVDRTLTTRLDGMDNQISRLRSVVYLLPKSSACWAAPRSSRARRGIERSGPLGGDPLHLPHDAKGVPSQDLENVALRQPSLQQTTDEVLRLRGVLHSLR